MILQVVLLALVSAVRPSSFVAVYALVREPSPSRLMSAYNAAGLAFTLAVGAAVVWLFSGIDLRAGSDHTRGVAELAAGVSALGLGAVLLLRPTYVERAQAAGAAGRGRARMREHRITTRTAALAGPATHIPGLLYLLALDLIVSGEPSLPGEVLGVAMFNAVWFALPLLVLALCILDLAAARAAVRWLERWAGAHASTIVLALVFAAGAWLLLDGITTV